MKKSAQLRALDEKGVEKIRNFQPISRYLPAWDVTCCIIMCTTIHYRAVTDPEF